ncbi:uncharacterized protein LOC115019359 [Cottoperca gobio]|uniref:Uncharacterized protein LOC115019359 n=1 Tax=Cottoperca gobio TaxID=56716 RepID=A0A6J2R5X2_COTGO|nr:uncharacterized protein LOC115019359 [Cottoperca gobio]
MSEEQQAAFRLRLTGELGGSSRVTCGGVGVVALALSVLFDLVAQQVRAQGSTERSAQRSQANSILGISSSSRIGRIIHTFLRQIPGIASNQEKMAETTELYDNWLKLELIDHYNRMTMKKRMSSVSMQQWLAGAAFHLHMRIHQVRLHSVPVGSAESLRLSYKTALDRLVQGFTAYLHRNIQETPRSRKPRTNTDTPTLSRTNVTCSSNHMFNDSLISISTSTFNGTATPNSTAGICNTDTPSADFGLKVTNRSDETSEVVINRKTLNSSTGYEDVQGLLVIEPWRNVSHVVQHHACESPAIQQALVTRIINCSGPGEEQKLFLVPRESLPQHPQAEERL